MKTRIFIIVYIASAICFWGCYKKQKDQYDKSSLFYILAFESFAKTDAAIKTATNNCNCQRIQPFYWEIGNANGKIVSGKFPNSFDCY